jgi:predicted nucleic acid-binding protein
MSQKAFLDTNILVYAAAGRLSDPDEFAIARDIVDSEQFYVSPLVLGEFYTTVRKRQHTMMDDRDARRWIEDWMPFSPLAIDDAIIQGACRYHERYKIQFWDAAHVATAERLGSTVLYSEDMNHGQKYGSVTVINPFKAG